MPCEVAFLYYVVFNKIETLHLFTLSNMKKSLLLLFIAIGFMGKGFAQINIAYPTAAQSITRSLDSTLLTVQLAFGAACNATTLTVKFPTGVEYIAGSVIKTAGGTITITESNINDKRKPIFGLNGITAPGDITFTVKRKADCGSGAGGKDTIAITGSCGTLSENAPNVNSYNLLSPAVSITAPSAISNAYINSAFSRNGTITNGGNGCLDTLRFYIVYPNAGIELVSNQLVVSGNNVTPYRINGDTLFFKIFGSTFFGAGKLLCNGQSVTFTENIKVKKCNLSNTVYNGGWGKRENSLCQYATSFSTVTMANGTARPAANITVTQSLSYCRDGLNTISYSNNGSGLNAGAMYNVKAYLGHNYGYTPVFLPRKDFKADIKNMSINGTPLSAALVPSPLVTGDQIYQINCTLFTADVDGAGVGLEDLDGDGQFDDLAPGKTFTVYYEEKWNCDNNCPVAGYLFTPRSAVIYNTMCGTAVTTPNLITTNPYYNYLIQSLNVIAPAQTQGGVPFTTQVCMNGQWSAAAYRPTDSLYLEVTLPPGFSLAGTGNITINGVAALAPQYSFAGNKLVIKKKGYAEAICYTYDLVYTCGVSGDVNINYAIRYVGDNSCSCQEKIACVDKVINLKCNPPCPNGIVNYQPVVKRVSMGFTNETLTTRVSPAAVNGIALKTVLPKDTLVMSIRGLQSTNDNNLYYYYQLGKAPNGNDVLQFVSGTFYHKSFSSGTITSCAVTAPVMSSTSALTKFTYNFTSCLQAGTIKNKDSAWVDIQYVVTKANNGLLYGNKLTTAPNTLSYFYNLDGSNNQVYCDYWTTDFLLCGIKMEENYYSSYNVLGCGQYYLDGEIRPIYEDASDLFPNEYRPAAEVDSIAVILPAGYEYDNSGTSYMQTTYWSSVITVGYYPNVTITPEIRGNKVVFKNPKNGTWHLTDYSKSTNYNHNRYFVPIKATCQTPIGEVKGGTEFYVKNYFYADKVGENYQKLYPTNYTTPLNLNSANKPSITIQNNTGTVDAVSEQHYWDVQVSNPGTVTAPSLWVALEKGSSNIIIDSVVLKPSNVIAIPISYSGVNKWYQLSAAGISGGANQQLRIYFKYLNCTADSIKMTAGWNCSGYPTDPSAYTCQAVSQWLKVNPLPSQVQLSILKQPDFPSATLCSVDTVSVIVNSAQAGDINNPVLKIVPPAGLQITTPIRVEYPLGSGAWGNITPSLVSGEYFLNLESHSNVGINGLKGTVKKPLAADRQIRIDIMYETSCGFTNGTKLNFVVQGIKPCGTPAIGNNDEIRSNPINISGATAVGTAATNINVSNSNIQCSAVTTINIAITPLISPTSNSDTATITLPAGINYIAGSFTGCGSCGLSTVTGTGGSLILKFKLPANAVANTPINFSIDVNADAAAQCRQYNIDVQTIRTGTLLMCGATVCSNATPVVLSSGTSTITVKKASLQILEYKLLGAGPFYPGHTYNSSIKVQNYGTINAAAGYVAEIFCIGDANPFAAIALPAINVGTTIIVTQNIAIPAGCSGGGSLMARINFKTILPATTSQCLCDESLAITAIVLPVKLISFKVEPSSTRNTVNWKTADESVGIKYEIQRSTDGINFDQIKEVDVTLVGSGDYSVTDNQLPVFTSKLFYRLKITEVGGNIKYSELVSVNKSNANPQGLSIAPNPASASIRAQFYSPANGSLQIIIYNSEGKRVKEWTKSVVKGVNSIVLDGLDSMADGMYIMQVENKDIHLQQKLYILK
jgi:Secretion system C-terminal sorting domain